jgi:hypothetical protein
MAVLPSSSMMFLLIHGIVMLHSETGEAVTGFTRPTLMFYSAASFLAMISSCRAGERSTKNAE